jgi:hypothetical protein
VSNCRLGTAFRALHPRSILVAANSKDVAAVAALNLELAKAERG